MSTTTMNHPRRFLTPNKRKERDHFDVHALKPSTTKIARPSVPIAGSTSTPKAASEPVSNNQLLAGYLAHEFLTKGTLFGEPWDPARAEAVPVSVASTDLRKMKSSQKAKAEPSVKAELQMEKYQRYAEVADLLKTDEAHLPGIVNPSQLARFFQL
uniref:Embryo sac development arrest 6 n=1 Tax=Davidia involucrata TaxID=16924 RepID=A0A5B6YWF9_DAVIN